MTAGERLTQGLVRLASEGRRPPCGEYGGHKLWTSDEAAERALAAQWCQDCLLIQECHDAAEERNERWHVWAGIDRGSDEFSQRRRDARQGDAS